MERAQNSKQQMWRNGASEGWVGKSKAKRLGQKKWQAAGGHNSTELKGMAVWSEDRIVSVSATQVPEAQRA